MTQIQNFEEVPVTEFYAAVERNKDNPGVMLRPFLELVNSVRNGELGIMDATNPTVMLAEMMSVGVHASLQSDQAYLRREFPSLAEQPKDLVDHMSDWDFVNMFASPPTEPFLVFIGLEAFKRAAVRDETEKCVKIVIPRDTYIKKEGRIFTLHYPIVIRLFDVGNLEVSYDASIPSNFQALETNIIANKILKTPDDAMFITFEIPVMQVEINRYTDTTSAGQRFERVYPFTNQFYHARAWYRNSSTNNEWLEMNTTHGHLNYDRRNPTLLLTLEEGALVVRLPQVYMVDNKLLGDIAVDIYTTMGSNNERLPDDRYDIDFRSLDPSKNTQYTPQALSEFPRWASPLGILTGGKDGLTFEQKRSRVVHNSTGPQELPITPAQIQARLENEGFNIERNVDTVTERIFHANRKLPPPSNKRLITAANIGIHTFITEEEQLVNNPYVRMNGNVWTFSPKNLYEFENGIIRLIHRDEIEAINQRELSAKVATLNNRKFLYTPFHYVLDNSDSEFDLRAYYIDKPTPGLINFVRMNHSLQLVLSTEQREIVRKDYGFQIRIKILSGKFFKELQDSQVAAQLMFYPNKEETPVYIRGYIDTMVGDERVFAFDIKTNYEFNSDNAIRVSDLNVNGVENQVAWMNLKTEFNFLISTSSLTANFVRDETSSVYAYWMDGDLFEPIIHEKCEIVLGYPLKTLWRRARNQKVYQEYMTYDHDMPAYYTEDQYETNAANGTIWFVNATTGRPEKRLKHSLGDPIIDPVTNNQVYLYRKGEVIKEFGEPLAFPQFKQPKEVDFLFIDGRHYFVTDETYKEYNQELVDVIVDWVTDELEGVQKRTLDKTRIFYYPKSQIGTVRLDRGDGIAVTTPSEQSPRIDMYLSDAVYDNATMRETIKLKTVAILDKMLSGTTLNNSEISDALRDAYGTTVMSFRLHGFGPNRDIFFGNVLDKNTTLSLKRIIEAQPDGYLVMREDVTFNFYRGRTQNMM